MGVSEVAPRGKPELYRVSISLLGAEIGKAMSSVWLVAHEGVKGKGLGGNVGENIQGMSGDNVREVRDYGNAVLRIGSLVGRGVNGWGRVRKSRGRVRT
jgi:hypothetical protein